MKKYKTFRVGEVMKSKNTHTGELMITKINSIKTIEKTDDLIQLKERLNQEGFDFYYDELSMMEEFRTDDKGVVHMNVTKGEMLKLFNDDYSISIYDRGNGFELYRLEVFNQGKGLGSKFLQVFNKISCEMDYPIYLKPGVPGAKPQYAGMENSDNRFKFYFNNGFEIVKEHFKMPTFNNQKLVDEYYG